MAKLTIALAQMPIILGDQRRNFVQLEKWMEEAARRGAKLLVAPELWSTGYVLEQAKEHASEISKGMFTQLSTICTQHKMAFIGSVLEKRGQEVANSAPFFAPNGRMMGIYRKLHLFRLMQEDQYLQPGSSRMALDLPWGMTALAICYDLRFPELFRQYVHEDKARLIVIPAEWPLARIEHWRALLIARAIENQCYIIACNTCGQIGDTMFGGHSMIVDPWGKVVIEAGEDPQLITAEIELDRIDEVRAQIPALDDVRFDIYG